MTDWRIKATAAEGSLRAIGAVTTESARAVQWVHHAAPLAAAAMGRLMTAAALLAADYKQPGESIHLETRGGGPLGRVISEAYGSGLMRARVDHPGIDLPLARQGKLAVGQAVGHDGQLMVRRRWSTGAWYTSVSPLRTGEIGDDVAHYLVQTEQVRSAVVLGVLVGTDGIVEAAGGLLVQALPDGDAALIEAAADRFAALEHLSRQLADGVSMRTLMARVLPGPIVWAEPETLRFGCLCGREQSAALLAALPPDELMELKTGGGAEVVCHYCRTAYRFSDPSRVDR